MKKFWMLLLLILLTGCSQKTDTVEINCVEFPDSTFCQTREEVTNEEITEEVEEVVEQEELVLVADIPYTYSNGSEFFDAYFSMTLYLTEEQNGHDFYSVYMRLGEKYHYLSDKYGNEIDYITDYSDWVSVKDINENPTEKHYLSEELYDLIVFAVENNSYVNGYFDITIDPVSSIWHDYREKCTNYGYNPAFCELPSEEELVAASSYVDINGITLNDDEMSIQMLEGMSLDLGAVAKGYFVERLAEEFIARGAQSFIISAGGNVKTYGLKPEGEFFTVGVQDPFVPRGQGILEEVLHLPGGYSVVSSGDQEKYFLVDDEVYHHIINPHSLYPDHITRQITIVTNDSGLGDVLSTSLYIMPLEESIAFVEANSSVEAMWVTFDGEVILSSGMDKFIVTE